MDIVQTEGTIGDIIFRNDLNGYTVFEVKTEDELNKGLSSNFTAVGCLLDVKIGDYLKLFGRWIEHQYYGNQFKVEWYEKIIPEGADAVEKYLASGIIPSIGPKTAKKIVELFGADTIRIIENTPLELTQIKGISKEKAEKIGEIFKEQANLRGMMLFLQKIGVSTSFAIEIYKVFGENTEEAIRQNPYALADLIKGIGFKTADGVAQKLGISKTSPYRIKSGITFALFQASLDGHTYLPEELLIKYASELLGVEADIVGQSLADLIIEAKVKKEMIINPQQEQEKGSKDNADKIAAYYLPFYLKSENRVAIKLKDLASYQFNEQIDFDKKIKEISKKSKITFAKNQQIAIKESLNNGVIVLTGGPGTGKTTTINAIIAVFMELGKKVELAAPTGRAAKRITQSTGMEAKTIHRLLEMGYQDSQNVDEASFTRNESFPLECDVLIIDEMSMVDITLMDNLLKAVVLGSRLVLVGDADQLPSVGPGNVLRDIINCELVKVVRLDEIFRQAQESMIIVNAHRINQGENPDLSNPDPKSDFFFMGSNNPQRGIEKVCELCKMRLPAYKSYNPFSDIQVIAPMKKGSLGVINLNKKLQEALNPPGGHKKEIVVKETTFRTGDKVMQIKNNYEMEWSMKDKPLKCGTGVFNGDIGIIQRIDTDKKRVTILFDDDKVVEYSHTQMDEIELAYAVTIHKSQGSEFKAVIIPLAGGPPMIMNRNLLYTGVTRAKEMVVILGSEECVYKMIENNYQRERYSGLSEKIKFVFQQA